MTQYAEVARLLDGASLRALGLAVRGELEQFEPPDTPDPTLVDLVDRPFESVSGAHERLSRLERTLRERGDRRAVFLTIYVRMTHEVHEGIVGGRFADPEWMRRYLVAFANYYRRAFLEFERGNVEAVPAPWRVAFGTALRGDALVVQDSFLGVNAHINYDLALAVSDVGMDPDRAGRYADHLAIDDVLAGLVDAQQAALAEVYARGIEDVDAAFGRLDESFTLRSMTEGREQAWRVAVLLTDLDVPPIGAWTRWVLRTTATGGAFFVLGPRLDPAFLRAARTVEAEGVDLDTILERVDARIDEETRSG